MNTPRILFSSISTIRSWWLVSCYLCGSMLLPEHNNMASNQCRQNNLCAPPNPFYLQWRGAFVLIRGTLVISDNNFSLILKGSGATDLPCPSDTFDTTGNTYTYSGTAGNSITLKFTGDNQQQENGFMAVYYETSKSVNCIMVFDCLIWSSCIFRRTIRVYMYTCI